MNEPIRPTPRITRLNPAVIVVASSTGGPTALSLLLEPIPATFSIPIVVVQHMPEGFTRSLAERLNRSCNIEVREAQERDTVQPGQCLIAAGGVHLKFSSPGVVVHDHSSPVLSCRPAADVLFNSAAQVYGPRVLGVILTGMGHDGTDGGKAIVSAGGRIYAQDQHTSAVWGMPGSAVNAGITTLQGSPERLAGEIMAVGR